MITFIKDLLSSVVDTIKSLWNSAMSIFKTDDTPKEETLAKEGSSMTDKPKILDPQSKYDEYQARLLDSVALPTNEEYHEMLLMLTPYGASKDELEMADEESLYYLMALLSSHSPCSVKALIKEGKLAKTSCPRELIKQLDNRN